MFSGWFYWFLPAAELGFQLQAVMSYPALQGMSQLVLGRGSCVILSPSAGLGGVAGWAGGPGGPGGAWEGGRASCRLFCFLDLSEFREPDQKSGFDLLTDVGGARKFPR